MDINNNASVTQQTGNTKSSQEAGPNNSDATASHYPVNATTADRLTLSETARLIDSLADITSTFPPSDQQRIAKLQQEITAGTFNIDPVRITERLLQFSMSLR